MFWVRCIDHKHLTLIGKIPLNKVLHKIKAQLLLSVTVLI